MAEVRLPIDNHWRDRLRAVRHGQVVVPEVEAILHCEAVFLYGWLGNSAHLGLDGRVVAWAAADACPPQVLSDAAEVARLIALGSRWLGLSDLVELLPPMPSGSVVCPYCEGRRWDDTPHEGHPEGGVCLVCKGVGWRVPGPAEPAAAPNPAM